MRVLPVIIASLSRMIKSLIIPACFTVIGLAIALKTDNWVWLGVFAVIGIGFGLAVQTRRK